MLFLESKDSLLMGNTTIQLPPYNLSHISCLEYHHHDPQLNIAQELFSQGWEYYKQHDYAAGIDWLQKALTIREQVLGTYHKSTGKAYWALGWAMYNLGHDPEQAHWMFRRAWRIFYKLCGQTHIFTKTAFKGIKLSLLEAGFVDKAATHYQAILNESLKHEQQGDFCWRSGEYVSAVTEYRTALVPLEDEALGIQGPDTAELYCKVASCILNNKNKHHQLLQYRLEFLHRQRQYENQLLLDQYGSPFENRDQYSIYVHSDKSVALELYCQAMSIYQSTLGTTHPDTISTFGKIKQLRHSSQSCCWSWLAPLYIVSDAILFCFPPSSSNPSTATP